LKNLSYVLLLMAVVIISCKQEKKKEKVDTPEVIIKKKEDPIIKEFGYNLNDFKVFRDTIRPGDSFGAILDSHGISKAKVFEISNKIKDTFNVAKIAAGKAYTVLKSKDTTEQAQVFVYQNGIIDYTVVDFRDSIVASKRAKPVKTVERVAYGTIESNLSQTFDDMDLSFLVAYKMADIYAWTIDFTRLQAGDQFKVIYTEKYINDTIPAGIGDIKASYFEHRSKPIYAFQFDYVELSLEHPFNSVEFRPDII